MGWAGFNATVKISRKEFYLTWLLPDEVEITGNIHLIRQNYQHSFSQNKFRSQDPNIYIVVVLNIFPSTYSIKCRTMSNIIVV
jgi:hypothetical protein